MKKQTSVHNPMLAVMAAFCITSLPQLLAQNPPISPAAMEKGPTGNEEALNMLAQAAGNYVAAYNNRDAGAISSMFTPLGMIVGSSGESLNGRLEIEAYHRDLFAGEKVPQIALEASEVNFVSPEVALENGVVHLTTAEDEPVRSIRYSVTHAKQAEGKWLMAVSRTLSEIVIPSEQLKPLHWLVGEWTLESDEGARIDMVIGLDDSENFLLGEALFSDANAGAQSIHVRIGWNPATASVYWWTFDSEGGNSSGRWARSGDEWVSHTTGITADSEATSSTQRILRDGETMVWVMSQRVLEGEVRPDVTYRFVRRAPDPISVIEAEGAETSAEPEPAPATGGE